MMRFIKKFLDLLLWKRNKNPFDNCSNVEVSKDLKTGKYFNIQLLGWRKIAIKEQVEFREFCCVLLMNNAVLEISEGVFFNNYCSINCLDNISIGTNSLFGEGVKIYDHNHRNECNNGTPIIYRNEFTTAPIKIGSNCWIGSNVTILKGVEIGDNVIIGANCLIYKSIPSNTVVKYKQDLIISTNS